MAASRGAAVELHPLVRRAFFSNRLMTFETVISGQSETHTLFHFGSMLDMAGDALASVQQLHAVSISRICELCFGMRIVGRFEFLAMAALTRCLQGGLGSERVRVAALTRQLDLVVPVAGRTRQKQGLVGVFT
jgi:hypothetical protein